MYAHNCNANIHHEMLERTARPPSAATYAAADERQKKKDELNSISRYLGHSNLNFAFGTSS